MLKKVTLILMAIVMVFNISVVSVEAAGMKIPDSAKVYNGHAYKIYNKSMTWTQAKKYCEKLGGHLVTVTSDEEREYVDKQLKKAKLNCYWIGLKYNINKEKWAWVTGEKVKYENWTSGEPNNYENNDEIYVHLFGKEWGGGSGYKYVGQWNDVANTGAGYANSFYSLENFGFICEWELPKPKEPSITKVIKKTGLIKGKTSANATVYIKNGDVTYKGKADDKGIFSVETKKIKRGDTVKVSVKNKYGMKSKTKVIQVW